MTRNQIAYREHEEQKRHNLADEAVRQYTASSEAHLREAQGLATALNAESQRMQAEASLSQADSARSQANTRAVQAGFESGLSLWDTFFNGIGSIAKLAALFI